jgi:hypothetical protein
MVQFAPEEMTVAPVAQAAPSGPPVLLVGERGQFYEFPKTSLDAALQSGFRMPTEDELLERQREQKYGDSPVAALALGAARGLTLGASDMVAGLGERAGILPEGTGEAITQIKERNPQASIAGEIGSIAVPVLGQLAGASAVGKAARAASTLQTGLASIGKGVASATEKAVGASAARFLAPAAQLASEAALYQTARNLSDTVLQQKDISAESILQNVPQAALFGGSIGLALPVAKMIAEPVIKTADRAFNAAVKRATDFFDPERTTQLYSGAMGNSRLLRDTIEGNKFKDAVANLRKAGAFESGDVAFDPIAAKGVRIAEGPMPSQTAAMERFGQWQDDIQNALKSTYGNVDAVTGLDTELRAALSQFPAEAEQQITKRIAEMAGNGVVRDPAALMAELGTYKELFAAKGGSLAGLNDLKKGIYERIGELNFNRPGSPEVKVLKDIGRAVKSSIEAGTETVRVKYPGISNELGRVGELNRLWGDIQTVKKPMDALIQKGNANANMGGMRWRDGITAVIGAEALGGGVTGGVAGLGLGYAQKMMQTGEGLLIRAKLGEQIKALSWVRQQALDTEGAIRTALRSFAIRSGEQAKLGAAVLSSPTARMEDNRKWYDKTRRELLTSVEDINGTSRRFELDAGGLDEHAPEVAEALIEKRLQVLDYLTQQMPKDPSESINPLNSDWTPSEYEIRQYRKVVEAARKPLSVLEDLKRGTVSPKSVQTVRDLYPQIYRSMVEQAAEVVQDRSLPYSKRIRLSVLLGVPMDRTMTKPYLQTLMMANEQLAQQQQEGIKTSSRQSRRGEQFSSESERLAGR